MSLNSTNVSEFNQAGGPRGGDGEQKEKQRKKKKMEKIPLCGGTKGYRPLKGRCPKGYVEAVVLGGPRIKLAEPWSQLRGPQREREGPQSQLGGRLIPLGRPPSKLGERIHKAEQRHKERIHPLWPKLEERLCSVTLLMQRVYSPFMAYLSTR